MPHRLDAPVSPHDIVVGDRSACATGCAKGRHDPAVAEHRCGHRLEKSDGANAAVATTPAPCSTRMTTDRVALQAHRKPQLEDFGIGQARIGHMRLNHCRAIEAAGEAALGVKDATRARATRNRLVVLVALVAEGEIAHAVRAAGQDAECAIQRIGDRHRGLDIAGNHRPGMAGIEHAAGRHDDFDWREAAGIHRNIVVDQGPEHIEHRRGRDRQGRVEVVRLLCRGAGEIDAGAAGRMVDGDRDPDDRTIVEGQLEATITQRADHPAHRFGSIVLNMAHIGLHHRQAEVLDHAQQLFAPLLVGRDLCLQIGHVLVGIACGMDRAVEQRPKLPLTQHTARDQPDIGEQHAFVVNVTTVGRHRPGRESTDVGMVAARSDPEQQFSPRGVEDRRDHGDIGQMGAAAIGIVEHEHIARRDGPGIVGDHRLHARPHRAEMYRHVRRVGDQGATGVENRT